MAIVLAATVPITSMRIVLPTASESAARADSEPATLTLVATRIERADSTRPMSESASSQLICTGWKSEALSDKELVARRSGKGRSAMGGRPRRGAKRRATSEPDAMVSARACRSVPRWSSSCALSVSLTSAVVSIATAVLSLPSLSTADCTCNSPIERLAGGGAAAGTGGKAAIDESAEESAFCPLLNQSICGRPSHSSKKMEPAPPA
eukprot:scaffold115438_cov23-Tisochrysis_lutea.AAC.3